MAFDGVTIANIVSELNETITGGRISKIAQPEKDELLLTIKSPRGQHRLLISASASLPLIYLTQNNRPSPMTAPNFCMLLRKHMGNGKILSVTQPSLERIIKIEVEHLDELGDLCHKYLIVEIMGKHSNIIFCTEEYNIIDSIKHVTSHMSSVREVLPGRTYFIPQTQDKLDPLTLNEQAFYEQVLTKPMPAAKALYTSITGISPLIGEEICYRASVDGGILPDTLTETEKSHFYHTFLRLVQDITASDFQPGIVYQGSSPLEYSSFPLTMYQENRTVTYESISQVLETYYATKNILTRIRQKSSDLRRIVTTAMERNVKKYQLQQKQMKDTEKKDKYRVYGELINTYGYELEAGCKSFEALNYYTNETIRIPLDGELTPGENSKKYFERYNKLKRTAEALSTLLVETKAEIEHLDSISIALDLAMSEADLAQIKEELTQAGYIRKKYSGNKKVKLISTPLHYLSSDGYHIYVGKNNFQNEEITFKIASGNDWWFHAKGMPGSHVIIKSEGEDLPDRVFEEAGRLAAYYSKGRQAPKVEIDYTQRKNLKKPSGANPGFVIYYTNYSLLIEPDISMLKLAD